jgi:heme-degrading monooxygenase HmoA
MILEIAQIDLKPGMESAFEAGVKQATPIFKRAKGCSAVMLTRYRLFVRWGTLENHTVDFRGSDDFQEWRRLVGHCFASPPQVEHVKEVAGGF